MKIHVHTHVNGEPTEFLCAADRSLLRFTRDASGNLGAPVAELAKLVPMQRLGRPDEIASLVVYLFSEGAGYITGQVISVNGGML